MIQPPGTRIKNYTSTIPVDRTISRIEALLVRAGASNIQKDYREGALNSICFSVDGPNSKQLAVKLPANVDAVYKRMRADIKRPQPGTLNRLKEQSARTAWKLMQDWLEVQISLIQMEQVEFLQIFLPYVWDGKKTFYAALKAGEFKQLTDGGAK